MPSFEESTDSAFEKINQIKTLYQANLDRITRYVSYRWAVFGALFTIFVLRIVVAQGWYIICYSLCIYLLSLFIQFLQPKFDMSLQQEMESELQEEGLSGANENSFSTADDDGEFRPFIRRLPEFKFWHNATVATTVSIFLSFFEVFNLPVFWPILVVYFIALFSFSMKRQIQHMIKYHYVPLDIGKTKYAGNTSK